MNPDLNSDPQPEDRKSVRLQARVVPTREGWLWLKDGWHLFRRQPMILMGILAIYLFAMLIAGAVLNALEQGLAKILPAMLVQILALFGAAAVATTVPGVTAGFMAACKSVLENKPVRFEMLLLPFRGNKRIRNALLILGTVQALALVLAVLVTPNIEIPVAANPDLTSNAPANTSANASTNAQVNPSNASIAASAEQQLQGMSLEQRKQVLWATLIQLLIYMPVTLLLWYAPMLVYWHECGASKAMFFSAAALLRNRSVFLAYFMLLSLILFVAAYAISVVLTLIGLLLGLGRGSLGLITPFVMVLLTWTYCTIYFSYRAVFQE